MLLALVSIAAGSQLRLRGVATEAKAAALPFDCYNGSTKGEGYIGFKGFTSSGRKCKNWLDEGTVSASTQFGIGNHNYCRNPTPGNAKTKPWCYTVDPGKKWEACDVKACDPAAATPTAWVAPKGYKSAPAPAPCVYIAPVVAGYKVFKADRACMSHRGDKWWLIEQKLKKAKTIDTCKTACSVLPGAEYMTLFKTPDSDGNSCGCYRECILVPVSDTVRKPTVYSLGA